MNEDREEPLGDLDEEGVVAALAELHLDVHQLRPLASRSLVQELSVLLEDGAIVLTRGTHITKLWHKKKHTY